MTEQEILDVIAQDKWMMKVISIASSLNLLDWAVAAGFVRNKVWDYLSGNNRETVDTPDIDLVYFDPTGNDKAANAVLSAKLIQETGMNWEVKNEYYMHLRNKVPPYTSTEDAMSQWPETVTAVGVTLDKNNQLRLIAPYGIGDLVNFVVRLSPNFKGDGEILTVRIKGKKWKEKWPQITVVNS